MFSHIMIGSNDIARSKKFYDALFAAMGAQPGTEDARGRLAYSHNGGRFMVSKPIDGTPARVVIKLRARSQSRKRGSGQATEIPGFPLARQGRINWPGALTLIGLEHRSSVFRECISGLTTDTPPHWKDHGAAEL